MRFPHINASPEELWRWVSIPDSDAEIEIKLCTRLDFVEIADPSRDMTESARVIASRFFRAFKNCTDAKGVEIPNTIENRVTMLLDVELGPFVTRQLLRVATWRD